MEILYIDARSGISGDMFLGALVDTGVPFENLREVLLGLDVPGFDLRCSNVKRHCISGKKVDVVVEDVPHPHRHLKDLLAIIDKAPLEDWVTERSSAVLTRLAEAESRIHDIPIEKVHLHEVGGLDCLVDVVGTVAGIRMLGVEAVVTAPISVGTGFVKCAHGTMPVPAPGTLALLEGFPIRRTGIPHELTTPTGAALATTLSRPAPDGMVFTARAVGYGAGTRDMKEAANLLRLIRAEADPSEVERA